ncbi:hypothetical protein [Ciceribacter selenitireducens]|uniref:Transmembrane protein n=1 Tax=Ciceribacter selenitireducens ATCC BAA-1503 TaxID=1336235 RepID=A0A376AKC1_9HYPH|nr:hypothetical protein [Ciceribacter selenitireducens]SSC68239.1 unnamed protein product [Ciceribacter selenitireducens ATCC BAA-1503]
MSIPVSPSPTLMPIESSASAVSLKSIIAGALAASAITLILTLIGSGLGLTMVSPWAGESVSLEAIGWTTAVWLVLVQWLSAAFGGYMTGRLRTKWVGVHTDEVFFRDTAHGFLAWALSTLLVAGLLGSVISSAAGTVAGATATAAGAAGTAGIAAAANASDEGSGFSVDYFADAILRPANPATPPAVQSDERVTAEVSRILINGTVRGEMPADDRAYLDRVVASRAGLSEADAKARVDQTLANIEAAKTEAQEAADAAKQAATAIALAGAVSLMIGAFIASVAAALGGRQRDEEEDLVAVI